MNSTLSLGRAGGSAARAVAATAAIRIRAQGGTEVVVRRGMAEAPFRSRAAREGRLTRTLPTPASRTSSGSSGTLAGGAAADTLSCVLVTDHIISPQETD